MMPNRMAWHVAGMDCAACEKRLATVLGRLEGVGHVEAEHASGRVALRFDPSRTDSASLAAAAVERIEAAGFHVAGRADEYEGYQR